MNNNRKKLFAITLLGFLHSGCGDPARFQKPVADFTEATNLLELATVKCLKLPAQIQQERNIILAWHSKAQLGSNEIKPPGTFTPADVTVRLRFYKELGKTNSLMAALAERDFGSEAKDEFTALGKNFADLATAINPSAENAALKATSESLATTLGGIAQAIINAERDRALREAIQKAAPVLRQAGELMKADTAIFIKDSNNSLGEIRAAYVLEYNTVVNATKLPPSPQDSGFLLQLAAQAREAQIRKDAGEASLDDYTTTVDKFEEAIGGLEAAAKSDGELFSVLGRC